MGHRDWVERVFVLARLFKRRVVCARFKAHFKHEDIVVRRHKYVAWWWCCKTIGKTKTLNSVKDFPSRQKRGKRDRKKRGVKKRAPKKGQKRGKKTTKIFFLFFFVRVRGNNLPIILFPPDTRARAFHDSLLDFTRTKNAFEASASNSFERKGTRRDFVFFRAARFGRIIFSPTSYARFDFFGRHVFSLGEETKRRGTKTLEVIHRKTFWHFQFAL